MGPRNDRRYNSVLMATTTTPAKRRADRDLSAPRHQALGSLLGRVWAVDQVGVEERAASLAKRSIKRESKLWALDLAIRMVDLTTLEGKDTPGKIRALAGKARRPDPRIRRSPAWRRCASTRT